MNYAMTSNAGAYIYQTVESLWDGNLQGAIGTFSVSKSNILRVYESPFLVGSQVESSPDSKASWKRWNLPRKAIFIMPAPKDPVKCALWKKRISEAAKKQWADPEYVKKHSKGMKKIWGDEGYRKKRSVSLNRALNKPEYKVCRSILSKKQWNNPEYVRRLNASHGTPSARLNNSKSKAKMLIDRSASYDIKPGVDYMYSEKAMKYVPYRGSLELAFIELLDRDGDVKWFSYECAMVPYEWEGDRLYVPDFTVLYTDDDWEVIEIKPSCMMDDPRNVAKHKAAGVYYGKRFIVMTEDDIQAYEEELSSD